MIDGKGPSPKELLGAPQARGAPGIRSERHPPSAAILLRKAVEAWRRSAKLAPPLCPRVGGVRFAGRY